MIAPTLQDPPGLRGLESWVTFPLCLLPLFRAPRVSVVFVVGAVEVGQKGGVNRLHLEIRKFSLGKNVDNQKGLENGNNESWEKHQQRELFTSTSSLSSVAEYLNSTPGSKKLVKAESEKVKEEVVAITDIGGYDV